METHLHAHMRKVMTRTTDDEIGHWLCDHAIGLNEMIKQEFPIWSKGHEFTAESLSASRMGAIFARLGDGVSIRPNPYFETLSLKRKAHLGQRM